MNSLGILSLIAVELVPRSASPARPLSLRSSRPRPDETRRCQKEPNYTLQMKTVFLIPHNELQHFDHLTSLWRARGKKNTPDVRFVVTSQKKNFTKASDTFTCHFPPCFAAAEGMKFFWPLSDNYMCIDHVCNKMSSQLFEPKHYSEISGWWSGSISLLIEKGGRLLLGWVLGFQNSPWSVGKKRDKGINKDPSARWLFFY